MSYLSNISACYKLFARGIITSRQMYEALDLFEAEENAMSAVPATQPTVVDDATTVVVTRRRFTDSDMETLKRLYAKGWTTKRIAEELGRTHATIIQKVKRLQQAGVLPKRYRPRKVK